MCQTVCAGGLPSCQPALCVKPENLPQPVTFVPRADSALEARLRSAIDQPDRLSSEQVGERNREALVARAEQLNQTGS